ncbi:MAG: hypothetical protein WC521_04140 [Bdellovibrionales bacterium]
MTDTFGSDPHEEDREETVTSESDVTQESEDVVSDQPSQYEFETPDDLASVPARRSPFLPIAAAIGGVLLLGSVAWWQLTGGASFSLPSSVDKVVTGDFSLPSLSSAPTVETAPPATDADASGVSPKTDSSTQKEEAPADFPLEASSGAQPILSETPVPQNKPVEDIPQTAPVAAFIPAPSTAPVVEVAPVAVSTQATEPSDRRVETLTARVDSLQKSLDQANQQVGQMTAALAAASNTQTSSSSTAKEMQAKIDKLEQQLAATNRPAAVSAEAPVAATPSVSEEATPAPAPKVEKAAPVKHKAVRKPVRKASKPAEVKPVSGLVLRAVSSGHAWISKGATSPELTEVLVGDKLSGVGTITAIEELNGKWIVRGTKGSIQ